MQYGHKDRTNYQQHGPNMFCINRTLIQKRLLVKFSCELPTLYLLKRFTHCVVIGLYDQQLPQQQNLTTLGDSAFRRLLTSYSYLFSTMSSELNVKKKHKLDPRHKGVYQLGRGSLASCLHGSPLMYISHMLFCGCGSQIFIQKACAAESPCDLSMQSSSIVQ